MFSGSSHFSGLHFDQVMDLCTISRLPACVSIDTIGFLLAKQWISRDYPLFLSMMVEYRRHRKTTKHPTTPHCQHRAAFVQIGLARTCFHQLLSNCYTLDSGHVIQKMSFRFTTAKDIRLPLATHLFRRQASASNLATASRQRCSMSAHRASASSRPRVS